LRMYSKIRTQADETDHHNIDCTDDAFGAPDGD
jgi:hypothetical protein